MQSSVMAKGKLHLIQSAGVVAKSTWRIERFEYRGRKQVAAVCYRLRAGKIEFLLVRTRKDRWIFPKGGVEAGLTHSESAALEAMEEAGAHGRIEEAPFASYRLKKNIALDAPPVKAYLCCVTRLEPPQEAYRTPTWFSEARTRQRLNENRSSEDGMAFTRVIEAAVARLRRLEGTPQNAKDKLRRVRFESGDTFSDMAARSIAHLLRKQQGDGILTMRRVPRPKVLQLAKGSTQR